MVCCHLKTQISKSLFSTGLYGNEGVLPARWMLRISGKSVWEQLKETPTLLWFGPKLGLDTQQCMELLSLAGALLSLAATAIPALRDCRVYLMLWVLYLSLYQVHHTQYLAGNLVVWDLPL